MEYWGKLEENWDFWQGCSCSKVTLTGCLANPTLQLPEATDSGSWLDINLKSDK